MTRVATLLFGCTLVFALAADRAHGAPPAKPTTKKATKKSAAKTPTKKAVVKKGGVSTANSVEFSRVSGTLKSLVEVPTTNMSNPGFLISMGAADDTAWWALQSCSVEQI